MLTNRFSHSMPVAEIYQELHEMLSMNTPVNEQVDVKDLALDLVGNRVIVAGEAKPLGERGKSMLYDRLGLGKLDSILSYDTLEDINKEINEYLKGSEDALTLKSKAGLIQSVVTDNYREIPYTDTVSIMEHLGARPIRVYQNDMVLRMQAIFDQYTINPKDGEPINLGVQLRTSDMGVGALNFDVFTYRWICENGCIMGKKAVGNFRTVHVNTLMQAEQDAKKEIETVLKQAQGKLEGMINNLIGVKYDQAKVVDFLAKTPGLGKKALAVLAERIVVARPSNIWEVVNVLTLAGHSPDFSETVQQKLEEAAGSLMALAA